VRGPLGRADAHTLLQPRPCEGHRRGRQQRRHREHADGAARAADYLS
jgi:hypothetical protein